MDPKKLVRRYIEALNDQDWSTLATFVAEDLVRHCAATPELQISSREGFLGFVRENAGAFPDLRHEIEMMVAEGDLVALYCRISGTQRGPIGAFPALGKRVEMPFVAFLRIANDQIAEMWVEWDNVCFLGQLGHM